MAVLQGVGVTGSIVPKDSLDTYPTHESVYGKGSHRSVVDITERNNITEDRREWGMLVTVWDDANPSNNAIYELKYGESSTNIADNANWVVLSVGGSGGLTTSVSFQYETPADFDTITVTSTTENHCLLIEAGIALNKISIISPANPVDGQVFEIRIYGFVSVIILDGVTINIVSIPTVREPFYRYNEFYYKYRYSDTEAQWFLIDKHPTAENLSSSGSSSLTSQAGLYRGNNTFDKLSFKSLATRSGTPLTLFSTNENVIIEFGSDIPSQEIYSVADLTELSALPTGDLVVSDLCLVLDTGDYYFWDGSSWILFPETAFSPGYLKRMGSIDCSVYPNYPAGGIGEYYSVSLEGKIGGTDGKIVGKGDIIVCIALSGGGDETAEGSKWEIVGNAKYNTMNLSTGIITGGTISANYGDTTFDVIKGNGIIVNNVFSLQGTETIITEVIWNNYLGITLDYLATNVATYLYIDSSGILNQSPTPFTQSDIRSNIIIGVIYHPSLTQIEWYTHNINVAYGTNNRVFDLAKTFGPLKKNGVNIVPVTSTLEISILDGEVFAIGTNYQFDINSPDLISIPSFASCKICRISNIFDAAGGTYYSSIDPDVFLAGGSPHLVTPGYWTIQRVFLFPEFPDTLYCYYGWAEYETKGLAIDGIYSEVFNEYEPTKSAVFLGYIIVQEASTDLSNPNEAVFVQSGLYRGSNVSIHGGIKTITGLNINNTDSLNPVIEISVDGVTITGDGTPGSPLESPNELPSQAGNNGKFLTTDGLAVSWDNVPSGFANPMTNIGDIIIGDTGGSPIRLAAGSNGYVLTLSGGSPIWAAPSGGGGGMTNPMTTIGDIIIGSTSGSPIRLAAGSNGQVLSLSSGSPAWTTTKGSFGVTFDGQGGVISAGKTDWICIPYNCTITGWEIYGDTTGSCVIDIWKDTYANFPPTVGDTIAGTEKPTLSSARKNRDLSLTSFSTSVTAGDCIMFYVESCSVLTKINLIIYTNIII
jgi:hypothetical protein